MIIFCKNIAEIDLEELILSIKNNKISYVMQFDLFWYVPSEDLDYNFNGNVWKVVFFEDKVINLANKNLFMVIIKYDNDNSENDQVLYIAYKSDKGHAKKNKWTNLNHKVKSKNSFLLKETIKAYKNGKLNFVCK